MARLPSFLRVVAHRTIKPGRQALEWRGSFAARERTVSAKNIYHDLVVRTLTADGWTITYDPLRLSFGGRDLFVDLGAERGALAAEKDGRKIAVEIQSFLGASPVRDLEEAVGQYQVYRALLSETEPDRVPYRDVPLGVHEELLSDRFGHLIVTHLELRLLVFDETCERIVQWIEPRTTE
jgi:XisH protein